MEIMERPAAIKADQKRYFTGRPCRRGHISERYTSSGQCVDCMERPAAGFVKISLECHASDRVALETIAAGMLLAHGRTPAQMGMSDDERAYWAMVKRYRAHGATTESIPRSLRTFTLPDGVDP